MSAALIDRGMVMIDYLKRLGRADSYKAKYEALAQSIDNAPVVDAEPVKRGAWILTQQMAGAGTYYILATCSECKTTGSPLWKCCPVCTARMDAEPSKEV